MKRRKFLRLVHAAVVMWPVAAFAQQTERLRRIALLNSLAAEDPEAQARNAAFIQALEQFGWVVGRNVQLEARWGAGNPELIGKLAYELAGQMPDVIFASGGISVAPLLQATRNVPIVFAIVPDPVGAGFVESLARPGGNATGFLMLEFGLSSKWLELLKEVSPDLKRVAIVRDPTLPSVMAQLGAIQSAAPALGVDTTAISLRDANEIERAIASFARTPRSGLIVTATPSASIFRNQIIMLAARHKLPAVYYERNFVAAGGLISYGPDFIDQFRRGAAYVDRILKGEKPADLPVQAPTKYELVINLKTAKALGLTLPPTLLARADAVIE